MTNRTRQGKVVLKALRKALGVPEYFNHTDAAILIFMRYDKPERFWRYVDKDTDGCWNWTRAKKAEGYGVYNVTFDGHQLSNVSAHRLSYALTNGSIPPSSPRQTADSLTVDHVCKNPSCVRPSHLEIVTHAENLRRKWVAA